LSNQFETIVNAHNDVKDPNRQHALEHKPAAAVITCSDARVAPALIFNQPAGSLFVCRVAGNTATPAVLASTDYAVAELGVELVVVLGHTDCGAVTAAANGHCDGYLAPLTRQICALATRGDNLNVDELTRANVQATVEALTSTETPTGCHAGAGNLLVQGAIYDLATDELHLIEPSVSNKGNQ